MKAPMQILWFVRFTSDTGQVVFNFTLPIDSTEAQAFAHGRTMFNSDAAGRCYALDYRDSLAEIVCRTPDTVLCFEPC